MPRHHQILIVDRDRATRNALAGAISALGHICVPLDHERGLLDRLRETAFSLLIVDPMLPLLDLRELLEAMRHEEIATTPLVLVPPGEADESWGQIYPGVFAAVERPDGGAHLAGIVEMALARVGRGGAQAGGESDFADQYEALFNASPDLIVVMDKERRIVRCNARMLRRVRAESEQLAGQDAHALLCGGDHSARDCPLGQALREGWSDQTIRRRSLWGGHFDIHSVPMIDSSGRLRGAIDILHDVTNLTEAEQALRRRLEVERLAVDISSRFVGDTDVNKAIDHALERIGRWSRAGRAYLYQFAEDAQVMNNTHEWCGPGVQPKMTQNQRVPAGQYLWLMAQLCSHKTIHVDDINKLPEEAHAEHAFMETSASRSLVAFPVHVGDRIAGFIGLDNVSSTREWRDEDRAILRMVAEVIGTALERHRAEMQHTLLATAINQLNEIVMVTGPDHKIEYLNSAFEEVTGYAEHEVLGRHPLDILNSEERPAGQNEELIGTIDRGEVWHGITRTRRKDGTSYDGELTICPVIQNDRIRNWVTIIRDVTRQRKLEQQLNQSQRLESIGQLAAGIAHEINTPIQYVGDNARFLKDAFGDMLHLFTVCRSMLGEIGEGAISAEVVEDARSALEATDIDFLMEEIPQAIEQSLEGIGRVARIVRAMKEFSHPGGQKQTRIQLGRAIESTVEVCRNEWKYVAELTLEIEPDLPAVSCHPGELNQAVLNLIINAAHAIGEVVGKSGNKGTITVRVRREGEEVLIEVADTGKGIPVEIREKIFDPFFTTKEVGRGTGQGLAIVHSVVVDKHAGRVWFETELGLGTTFTIALPVTAEPQAVLESEAVASPRATEPAIAAEVEE